MRFGRAKREGDGLERMTSYEEEYFKKRFPNLYAEIKGEKSSVKVDGVRTDSREAKKATRSGKRIDPTVVDFIRTCENEKEALDIINYMDEEDRIESDYADRLKNQLDAEGLDSFGPKREPGKYPSMEY